MHLLEILSQNGIAIHRTYITYRDVRRLSNECVLGGVVEWEIAIFATASHIIIVQPIRALAAAVQI